MYIYNLLVCGVNSEIVMGSEIRGFCAEQGDRDLTSPTRHFFSFQLKCLGPTLTV